MTVQTSLEDWQDYLEAALSRGGQSACAVRVYQETRSTQDIAKSFAPNKALVLADQQTAGRGRLGRSWLSTPGASVLMSVCWPDAGLGATHDRVSMLAGIAVARAVEQIAPDQPIRLKWPNDVMVEQKKLAGILIEKVGGAFVIGIGLNITPEACPDPELRPKTTCLTDLRRSVDRLRVVELIYTELERALGQSNPDAMLSDWRSRASLGQTQTFEHHNQQITGEVIDLDPDHGLIVRRDSGEIITLPAASTSVIK